MHVVDGVLTVLRNEVQLHKNISWLIEDEKKMHHCYERKEKWACVCLYFHELVVVVGWR